MTSLAYLIGIIAVLLLLPRLLSFILKTVTTLPEQLRDSSKKLFVAAHNQMTGNGTLSIREAASLTGGSAILTLSFITLAIMAYHLFAPALAPLLGVKASDVGFEGIAGIAQVTIAAAVITPICAGIWFTDLIKWSKLSAVSSIKKGRHVAFILAAFTLTWCILFGLDAGVYRAVIGLSDVIGVEKADSYAAYLGSFLLISIDALVLIGVFMSSVGIEGTLQLLVALIILLMGVSLYVIALLLNILAVFLDPICEFLLRAYAFIGNAVKGGFQQFRTGMQTLLD